MASTRNDAFSKYGSIFEAQLKMRKVKRCIQNVMNHQQLSKMNEKLINYVNQECVEQGLVKE